MGKNENAKQITKVAAHAQNTPVMTRGAAKAQQSRTSDSKSLRFSLSNSISSTDYFELLEKKLIKSLTDIISERFEQFEESISNRIEILLASTRDEMVKLNHEVEQLKNELSEVRSELEDERRSRRLMDAVITGIPCRSNENPQQLLANISAKVDHTLSPYATAFRPKRIVGQRNHSGKNMPLIVKFSSILEQREFIKKFKPSGPIKLNDISSNFLSDSRINAFESLTMHNNRILRHALRLKKENHLHSVFTRQGEVYVRTKLNELPIKVTSLDALDTIFTEARNAEA